MKRQVIVALILTLCLHVSGNAQYDQIPVNTNPVAWNKAAALNARAERLYRDGQYDAAINLLHQAIHLCPNYAGFYSNTALAYENGKKDFVHAKEYFLLAIKKAPKEFAARLALAGMFVDKHDLPEAERAYRDACSYAATKADKDSLQKLRRSIDGLRKRHVK